MLDKNGSLSNEKAVPGTDVNPVSFSRNLGERHHPGASGCSWTTPGLAQNRAGEQQAAPSGRDGRSFG